MRKVSLIEADGFKARLSGSRPSTRTQAGLKTHRRSQVFRVSLPQMRSTSLKRALVHEAKPSALPCTSTTCRTKMLSRSSRICDPFPQAPNRRRCFRHRLQCVTEWRSTSRLRAAPQNNRTGRAHPARAGSRRSRETHVGSMSCRRDVWRPTRSGSNRRSRLRCRRQLGWHCVFQNPMEKLPSAR